MAFALLPAVARVPRGGVVGVRGTASRGPGGSFAPAGGDGGIIACRLRPSGWGNGVGRRGSGHLGARRDRPQGQGVARVARGKEPLRLRGGGADGAPASREARFGGRVARRRDGRGPSGQTVER